MLDQLFEAIGMANTSNAARESQIAQEKKGLATQNIDIAEAMSSDMMLANDTKRQGALAAQDAGIAARDQMGNNPTDPESLMAILVQDFRDNTIAARTQQQAIAAKQQVGIFDDPLQFLVNQVTLPDEINAYNATASLAQQAKESIATMQSLTTASAQAQQATARSLTTESVAAQARLDIADSVSKINQAKIQSLSYDSEGIKALESANAQTLSMAVQKASLDMQASQFARSGVEHEARMKALNDKTAQLDDAQLLKTVNAGAALMGQPPIDAQTLKWMTKTAEGKRKFDVYFEQGMAYATTGSKVPGATPGEAIMNVLEVDGLRGEQNKPMREFMTNVARDAAKEAGITKFDEAGKKALVAAINNKLITATDAKGKERPEQSLMYKLASDVETPGNILKAPDLPQLVTVPAVQNNILFKSVLAPAAAAGITSSSPKDILAQAYAARDKGLINNNQIAAGMADLYTAASAVTHVSGGAAKFGLPYRPSYVVSVPSAFSINSAAKDYIDFAKPESVLSYMTALEARRRLDSIGVMQ
jgi:hypothetical protein